ncbi:MAG: pseudouridine synthase [bacterium]|nr:pseudouridine synthase [bacterium]
MARYPSRLTLPNCPDPKPTLLDYLDGRFPNVSREIWQFRLSHGRISQSNGQPVNPDTIYRAGMELFYYREVASEERVPFDEEIIFSDKHLLVACKPHFLPVTPGGKYVNECLLYRLRAATDNDELMPLHRLDRDTAGLLLFSVSSKTRALYANLFNSQLIQKRYDAIGSLPNDRTKTDWLIETRIEPDPDSPVMLNVEGDINARTRIRLIETRNDQARFELQPLTGKTHQLRLHLTNIGAQILNDRMYPTLLQESTVDYTRPLKLLAKSLAFTDPLDGRSRKFTSGRTLQFSQ